MQEAKKRIMAQFNKLRTYVSATTVAYIIPILYSYKLILTFLLGMGRHFYSERNGYLLSLKQVRFTVSKYKGRKRINASARFTAGIRVMCIAI